MNLQFEPAHGEIAEDKVQRVVELAFSPDFVFRSPRKKDDKEVTDVLALFDDVALVIESKSMNPDLKGREKFGDVERNLFT